VALEAPLRQRRAPDQQVHQQADGRLEEDEQQPALRGIGRATKWDDHDHRQAHRPFRGEEDIEPQLVVVKQRGHPDLPVPFRNGACAGRM